MLTVTSVCVQVPPKHAVQCAGGGAPRPAADSAHSAAAGAGGVMRADDSGRADLGHRGRRFKGKCVSEGSLREG